MKKNLISVVILALVFANFVLTALLMFSVLPETKKANTLIEKVCSAIDLDLNSGAATGTSNISIDDQEIYKVSEGEDPFPWYADVPWKIWKDGQNRTLLPFFHYCLLFHPHPAHRY